MVSVYEVSDADKRANYEWPYQFDAQTIPIQLQPLEMQQLEQRPPGMYQALKRQLTVASKIQAPEFLAAMQFIVEDVRKNNTQRYAIYSNFIEKGLDQPFIDMLKLNIHDVNKYLLGMLRGEPAPVPMVDPVPPKCKKK